MTTKPIQSLASIALLSPLEMAEADRLTIAGGASGEILMRRAAAAVAEQAFRMAGGGRVAVLAGPGNNGGDAFGAAALLVKQGIAVDVFTLCGLEEMRGEARTLADDWTGTTAALADFTPGGYDLVVDGLFGAGLSRAIAGPVREAIERLNEGASRVLAIDLPSGVSGADGRVLGTAVRAEATVTFFARKPGHLLQPGCALCGEVHVADIGIDPVVLGTIGPRTLANEPPLFKPQLLSASQTHHKYDRGHAVVFSGGASHTGAARLSAMAALRGGAGLVTVFSPPSALLVNAAHLTAIMLRRCEDGEELAAHLTDERLGTFVLGPGFGEPEKARAYAAAILRAGRRLVLDADGITAFSDDPGALFNLARTGEPRLVLTPHDGEFARLFPDLADRPSKLDRAREAARRAGAIIILKGSDTVIATPDGRAAINGSGTSALATAGTGDVLAGLVAAQLANGVPAFEAGCAAVWLHAEAARLFGVGLIAEDLPGLVPQALRLLADS